MKMILDFSTADFDPKKYFIYSDLLEDTGIECPDEDVARLCMLVNTTDELIKAIQAMSTDKLVDAYNFFDQYCISKGILHIFKSAIKDRTCKPCYLPACDTIYGLHDDAEYIIEFDKPLSELHSITEVSINAVVADNMLCYYDVIDVKNSYNEITFSIKFDDLDSGDSVINHYSGHGVTTMNFTIFENRLALCKMDNACFTILSYL